MAAMTVLFFAAALAMFLLLAQMAKKNEIGIQDGAAVLMKGGIFRKIREYASWQGACGHAGGADAPHSEKQE